LYRIPCQGEHTIEFSARHLPASLTLDPAAGIITGTTPAKGDYEVAFKARNSHGTATRTFKIVAGDQLALTPPMPHFSGGPDERHPRRVVETGRME